MDAVRKTVFAELVASNITTVGSTFNKCSGSKSKLTRTNSLVPDPVVLPCDGVTNGVAWTFSKCDFDDFNGYADAADAALIARGVNLAAYKYRCAPPGAGLCAGGCAAAAAAAAAPSLHSPAPCSPCLLLLAPPCCSVYLVPPGACGFVGIGYVGCDGAGAACRTWVGGNHWTVPQAIAHEMGHNMFMAHATSVDAAGVVDEYGDSTDMMGACCSDRCPNAAHSWQMGWLSLTQHDGSTLAPGKTVSVTIYAQSSAVGIATRSGGVRINPTWAAGAQPVFVGYRVKAYSDAGLEAHLSGRVHLHHSTITNTYDASFTEWRGSLAKGESWTDDDSGVVVRAVSTGSGSAIVSLCRKGGAETLESCRANLDNDCNGLVGSKDPACVPLLAAAV